MTLKLIMAIISKMKVLMPEGLAETVLVFGLDRISTSNNCQFCANKLNCLSP